MLKNIGKSDNALGIELSDSSIKIFGLKKRGKKYKLLGYNIERLQSGIVVDGEIRKPEKLIEEINAAFSNIKPKRVNIDHVISALPENNTYVREIELPNMKANEITEAIKWEAEKYIPLPIHKSYIDWQILSQDAKKTKLLLAAAPKSLVDSYIHVFEEAGLKLVALELEVVAQGRALISETKASEKTLIVDIGTRRTIFSIFENNTLNFSSSSPEISGNFFTEIIAGELGVKKSEAEKVKIKCCSAKLTKEERNLLKAVQPAYDKLALEIEKIIRYYRRNNKITKNKFSIILCGGGASSHGLDSYLSLKLRQKVVLGNPWINISTKNLADFDIKQDLMFAKVIGLALRGIKYKQFIGHD